MQKADEKTPSLYQPDPGTKDETMEQVVSSGEGSVDKVDEKKVLKQLDIRIIPVLAILYLMSFLDRANIGNARIEGMTEDLNIDSQQFNLCLTVFYFTYAAVEIPSNLLLKKFKPSVWLPSIMVAWGIVTTLTGLVRNYHGLLIARIFLGVAEGGLYPGIIFYATQWYSRQDAQYRQALFFASASLAGAFSGLLAFAIAKMDGVGGLEGWRWIFILEGILTVILAVGAFFVIYDVPADAKFLTAAERQWIIDRTLFRARNAQGVVIEQDEKFQWKYVKDALTDWHVLVAMFMNMGLIVPLYGISVFLPTIIRALGYVSNVAQLMTIPIYAAATISSIAVAWFADRHGQRSPFLIVLLLVTAFGYVLALAGAGSGLPGLTYAGVFVIVIGIYSAFPGNIAWISNNVAGNYKRATALAMHVGWGNMGGAMSSNFYRTQDSPQFFLGHGLSLGFLGMAMVAVITLRIGYQRANKKKETQSLEGYTDLELSRMGDKAPNFRYGL